MNNSFDKAIEFLPQSIKHLLEKQSDEIKNSTYEIRLRSGKPIALVGFENTLYVFNETKSTYIPTYSLPCMSSNEISEAFGCLCNYSVYSFTQQITNGFITTKYGHRVGISGTAVIEDGKIISVRDISSLNIRIAKEFIGLADELISQIRKNGSGNILVAGPPSSGKTTLLRDLTRQISDGAIGKMKKICVVDERQEIFSKENYFDEGINTDILSAYPKANGIQIALRTMSPDYIVTDEIGTFEEGKAICDGLNSGVLFALSIHASDYNELKRKEIFNIINEKAPFKYVLLLKGDSKPGQFDKIYSYEEIK